MDTETDRLLQKDMDLDSCNKQRREDRKHGENSTWKWHPVEVLLFLFLLPHWCGIGEPELITDVLNPHNRPSVVLLKLYGIKLPSKYSRWHLYMRATVMPNERGFFRKWALLNAQTHTWPKFRECTTVQFSDLSRTSEPQHAERLRDYFGRERQRL